MDIAPLSPPSSWIMQQASNWPAGARLIDIASGQGRHSTALAAAYPDRFDILAVDRDQAALAALKARCSDITTCHFDLETDASWPFSGKSFDVVLVTNYLYRPRLDDVFRLVGAGGYIAYETFGNGNAAFGRPSNPDYLLEEGELVARLPDNFIKIDYFHGQIDQPKPAIIQRLSARRAA